MTNELAGYYDVCYSPDDDGHYADLLWRRDLESPLFATDKEAEAWAVANGGKKRLR